jgi:ABC-type transport system involved in multi-copper enzyme maturation permease subunit
MSRAVSGPMIAADILKLRRHRTTMATSAALSVGVTALYLTVVLARHNGQLPGAQTLGDGTSLMGLYFGSFAAILIGAEAGAIDVTAGVFRDLVATGRSRTALFLTRIPAAVAVALAFTLGGFLLTVAAALAFHGSTPAPGVGLIAESALWVVLATAVVTALAVGVGSLTGSRAVTLTVIIGWQTVASGMLYLATFLGAARDLVLVFAVSRFQPGPAIGTRANPGSSNALNNLKLPMPAGVAALIILLWLIVPAVAGAWRTRTRDA